MNPRSAHGPVGQSWVGKRVLIAGGLGFIGANLAHRLVQEGATVSLIDCLRPEYGGNYFNIEEIRDRVSVAEIDLREREQVCELVRSQQIIFNLAGQTSHLDSMR